VQNGYAYAIIDEVDNILIDEARTPLIISGPAPVPRTSISSSSRGGASGAAAAGTGEPFGFDLQAALDAGRDGEGAVF
jgi:hypothetical protein